MFGQKRKSCGISILAEAATSVKQRKIYHVKEHVTQQHNMNTYIDTTIVTLRNIIILIMKKLLYPLLFYQELWKPLK